MKDDFGFNLGDDIALSVDIPMYDFDLLADVREALEIPKVEETPEFHVRLKKLYDAAMKLHQELRTKMTGKLQKLTSLAKKALPNFSLRSRARAHRSSARSKFSSSASNDSDGGDGSGDPDPPLPVPHFVTFSKPKFQQNSFSMTVAPPRQLQRGLLFLERGRVA